LCIIFLCSLCDFADFMKVKLYLSTRLRRSIRCDLNSGCLIWRLFIYVNMCFEFGFVLLFGSRLFSGRIVFVS